MKRKLIFFIVFKLPTMIQPEIAEDVSELLKSLLEMPCDTICTWMMNMDIYMNGEWGVFISEVSYEGEVDVIRTQPGSRSMFKFTFTSDGISYELTRGLVQLSRSTGNFNIGQSSDSAIVVFKATS